MNARLYSEHVTRLWYMYTANKKEDYRVYLSALQKLYRPQYDDVVIDDVEPYLLEHVQLFNRIPDTKWSTILWAIIDSLPYILKAYPSDEIRSSIVTLLSYMPRVAIECDRCMLHMSRYLESHNIDTGNLLKWIQSFKQSVEDEVINANGF